MWHVPLRSIRRTALSGHRVDLSVAHAVHTEFHLGSLPRLFGLHRRPTLPLGGRIRQFVVVEDVVLEAGTRGQVQRNLRNTAHAGEILNGHLNGQMRGLGLAIVAEIVKSHDGSIAVSEADDWGPLFCITLPTLPAPAASRA